MKIDSKISKKQKTPNGAQQIRHDQIFLGADVHKKLVVVTRIIDNGSPQPAQRFSWEEFYSFAEKQKTFAKEVHVVYEAGALGFSPYRKLKKMKLHAYVVHPKKLDPSHKNVRTDRSESRELADNLVRFVRGNTKAMTPIFVPSVEQEQERIQARHRGSLRKRLSACMARGRGLLLSQGIAAPNQWWTPQAWDRIEPSLCPQLRDALEDERFLIKELERLLGQVEKKLEAAAPKELPRGFGALTFVLLLREMCTFARFKDRRGVGGFTGLCGGVSASGSYHVDFGINKAGSPRLRAQLIELAWRMVYYQPNYRGVKAWHKICAGSKHARRRKIATVALARQLLVDIWRWQTGLTTPEQLGWEMRATA